MRTFGSIVLIALGTPILANAGVESVYVAKVMDDKAIVVRANGQGYLIEKGIGCLSFYRFEGKTVLVESPGLFLGVGSSILIPEVDQQCRIWNSEEVDVSSPPAQPTPKRVARSERRATIQDVHAALRLLGYNPGPPGKELSEAAIQSLAAFATAEKLRSGSDIFDRTIVALGLALSRRFPDRSDVLQLALRLASTAGSTRTTTQRAGVSGCDDGHWVASVSDGGEVVILEDGSVWQISAIDTIDTTLWLPTEDILVCYGKLINTDNGDKVEATRLR